MHYVLHTQPFKNTAKTRGIYMQPRILEFPYNKIWLKVVFVALTSHFHLLHLSIHFSIDFCLSRISLRRKISFHLVWTNSREEVMQCVSTNQIIIPSFLLFCFDLPIPHIQSREEMVNSNLHVTLSSLTWEPQYMLVWFRLCSVFGFVC